MVKNKKLIYWLIIRIEYLLIAILLMVLINRFVDYFPGVKNAISLATTKKPESFTELYFENHIDLPKKIMGSEQYKFTLTIHNLENRDMFYPYVVYLQTGDQKKIIFRNTSLIKNNEFKSFDETIGPLENLRTKVVIELTNKNQVISFWMEGDNPPSSQ